MKDWREQYVICEHVAENQSKGTQTSLFRVCCKACYYKGFLHKDLEKEQDGKLCIGRLKD